MSALTQQHCTLGRHSSRRRRPALIPHHADLSISLCAVEAALSIAAYSPVLGSNGSGNGGTRSNGVWVFPPPPPSPRLEPIAVAEICGEEFKRDVFTWVNTPTTDDERPVLKVDASASSSSSVAAMASVPTSPTSGGADVVERQKRRLEDAVN